MELYNHIELTEEETTEALRGARRLKHIEIEQREYWNKVKQPVEYPRMNSEDLETFLLTNNSDFVLDEGNSEIFNRLLLYFSGDPIFEEYGSLKKGILLYGPVGCGKTRIMNMFMQNSFRPFVINPVRKIADEYSEKDGGTYTLNKYSTLCEAYPSQNFGHKFSGRCFDDIGTEEEKKNFGNSLNVVQDVLYKIYDNRLIGNFHGTTNLNPEEIEAAYGYRIRSRMREMFNILKFDNNSPDRRG